MNYRVTPKTIHDQRMTPGDRLTAARKRANEEGVPVPNHVLRTYLDCEAYIRKYRAGLHNLTITVQRDSTLDLLEVEQILDPRIELRLEGQKY